MIFESKNMNLHINNAVPFLTFKKLEKIQFINHAFSTRLGGISGGEYFSMNLSFGRGDSDETVIENYKIFSLAAGFDFKSLVSSNQDHKTNVRVVTKEDAGVGICKPQDMESVDALITNDPEVTLITHYADCTPVFLVDTKNKCIGLVHSGWRGTVKRIAAVTVKKMGEMFKTDPKNIVAAIGPTISKCCFEVDKPVADEFEHMTGLDSSRFVFDDKNGKYHIDLLECNKQILEEAGVLTQNIELSDLCTVCCKDLLFSHRATKGKRGGMAAMMAVKKDV